MIGMGDLTPVEGNKGFDFGNLFKTSAGNTDTISQETLQAIASIKASLFHHHL